MPVKPSKFSSRVFFIFIISVILSGCVAVDSTYEGEGATYYLPKGLVDIELLKRKDTDLFAIKIHPSVYVPHEGYSYTASYSGSPFSHDKLHITLEVDSDQNLPTGFLSKIEFTADEQSDDFIIKLIDLAKGVAKISAFDPEGQVFVEDEKDFATIYRGTFDPFSSEELRRINVIFDRYTKNAISIFTERWFRYQHVDNVAHRSECIHSVCFRKPLNVPLIFKQRNGREFKRVNLVLPDLSKIGGVDISRAAFVKKITKINFRKGLLESIEIDKPSESLGAANIPIAIANAILAVPGEILKLKIDHSTESQKLHNARVNELKAKEALVEYQKSQLEKQKDADITQGDNQPET